MSIRTKNWIRTTVGEIALLFNGRAFKPSEWSAQGRPIVRIQNLNNPTSSFNHFDGPLADTHRIAPGELLFAWSGTPGTSFGAHIWRGPPAALNQHIFKVVVDETSVDREFLAAAINASMSRLVASAQGGAGLKHLTRRAFEQTPIMLPPLAEQRRIARMVREHGARTNKVRRLLSLASTTAEALRAAPAPLLTVNGLAPLPIAMLGDGDEVVTPRGRLRVVAYEAVAPTAWNATMAGARCARCSDDLRAGDITVACPACAAWHHEGALAAPASETRACWTYDPRCGGCGRERAALLPVEADDAERSGERLLQVRA